MLHRAILGKLNNVEKITSFVQNSASILFSRALFRCATVLLAILKRCRTGLGPEDLYKVGYAFKACLLADSRYTCAGGAKKLLSLGYADSLNIEAATAAHMGGEISDKMIFAVSGNARQSFHRYFLLIMAVDIGNYRFYHLIAVVLSLVAAPLVAVAA